MKNVIIILLITFLHFSCKKDVKVCTTYTELTDRTHLVDIDKYGDTALINYLTNHTELQVYKIDSYQTGLVVRCHVFYNDLKDFLNDVKLNKNTGGTIYSLQNIDHSSINFSVNPSVSFQSAITIAKRTINFSKTCVSYRLGVFDVNSGSGIQSKNYKLVWKIEGENEYPYVIVDANTSEVYRQDDGIRY